MSMTLSQTCDSLLDQLCLTPDDWTLRGIWADALEDAGNQHASDCVRWCVRHHKRPRSYRAWESDPYVNKRAQWYDESWTDGAYDVESDLPTELYVRLGGEPLKRSPSQINYELPKGAELALLEAWPLALADGFDPNSYEEPDRCRE